MGAKENKNKKWDSLRLFPCLILLGRPVRMELFVGGSDSNTDVSSGKLLHSPHLKENNPYPYVQNFKGGGVLQKWIPHYNKTNYAPQK